MKNIDLIFESLIEQLAEIEHQRWAHWQQYVHSKGIRQPDGSILIPADLVTRWERQIATPYVELTETEKASDREQVDPIIKLLKSAFET